MKKGQNIYGKEKYTECEYIKKGDIGEKNIWEKNT